ncbi:MULTISPECIES: hypothetical protein [unclassified Mesorhizobium]|uniref:hypothetical protein n=2 Tax=Mesorhizobium TaxID=68287 RepID=UPI000FC9A249|nr:MULTISPECIES: hypothetical protein [unclassified Mesorhizobium]RUV79071.1 hypothetical protein EOA88_24665 [Mesorhizobium sp. M5C.F.Ca.IN.020.14.1.1]RUV65111.1 hypothetical protein EOA85_00535 [Mesorhizobium sp. M5C.F.Ca.IN.020.29.1.1]RWH43474.1 MAG: hypothetical protein EOQ80_23475 [Mesorhizobium sp.]RWH50140.1 MAG: hypothetical protein EOQ82_31595 [Mesorhizobium sp.]RWI75099.1 MAG: hypothetical protein EOR18_10400 [Mesorhizobium sp.]
MTLLIEYQSRSFPSAYNLARTGTLSTSWDELLWAAITIGRPSTYHVFQHGPTSFHEAIFRLSLIRMAVEQNWHRHLQRTDAFAALDPTEKGMVSYFLGMTLCKLFSSRILNTPSLLHLDVFRPQLNPTILGRSRPDLVGENNAGKWYAFESKGRSSVPSSGDKAKAKLQAHRLVSIGGHPCTLHVGSFAFFQSDLLKFYWRDPDPDAKEPIELPRPGEEWRYYYEPGLSLASMLDEGAMALEHERADATVTIHPKIRELLEQGLWLQAREAARMLQDEFGSDGYRPDGLRVVAGESWSKSYDFSERR